MQAPTTTEKVKKQTRLIIFILGTIVYLALVYLVFQYSAAREDNPRKGFSEVLEIALANATSQPSAILPITQKTILIVLAGTAILAIAIVLKSAERALKKHDNPDTVNGEARLMNTNDVKQYSMRRSDPPGKPESDGPKNMILSQEIKLAIDNRFTRRNCNVLVIGGSGAGKSRFFASPNILQYNSNFVITDPSGELLRDYGKALEDNGYAVKVFNITDVYKGSKYNPFHYIREEKDIFIMVNTLIKNTTPTEGKAGDPFWENCEKLLITALSLYLWHMYPPEHQTFKNILKLLNMATIDENDSTAESPLDVLFNDLERDDKENLAVQQYKLFKKGAGKTLQSILISVGVRLQSFSLSDIQYLTSKDEFEFESFADTKQALFVIIPTADSTFNFIVSMMYSQLFASLYNYCETRASFGHMAYIDDLNIVKVEQAESEADSPNAEKKIKEFVQEIKAGTEIKHDKEKKLYRVYTLKGTQVGWRGTKEMAVKFQESLKNIKVRKCDERCPNHVRLILDEFANIGQIPDFDQKMSTIRKYEISCSIILQAISQLKEMYDKKWNTIAGNCDSKLFLGCDDSETIKWLVEVVGKKTTTTESTSWQGSGQGSTSYSRSSIEILTVDQITMLKDNECIVRVRGEHPYYGKKYELTNHPNYQYAQSVRGQFEIPVSPDVKKRITGPLRLRNSSVVPVPIESTPQKSDKDLEKQITEAKNTARKIKAEEAKRGLQKIEEQKDDIVDNSASLLKSFGVDEEAVERMSNTELKEQIESAIILDTISTDEIAYGMSQ